MNAVGTLLWLEYKRASWVLAGAAVAIALFAVVLFSIPGSTTGLELLDVPAAGEEQDCLPPDCDPSDRSQMQIEREQTDGGSSFSFSFSRTFGDEPDPAPSRRAAQSQSNTVSGSQDLPEELQFTFRTRQVVTVATSVVIPALMLLGFWIGYARESDRGDIVTLYQSPVSGDLQLFVRFLFMSLTMLATTLIVIAIYWGLQKSQSLSPVAPLVEALGGHMDIHWGSLIAASFITMTIPNAAFVLLFGQMQNAYDLLGGQRLVGLMLVLVSIIAFFVSIAAGDPAPGSTVLEIVSIESNAILDSMIDTSRADPYRVEVGLQELTWSAIATALMLFVSGRIWNEVEWS